MSKFGDVMEVFIPRKLNRAGKHFSFVSFKRNIDAQTLILSINLVSLDRITLVASLAKQRVQPPSRAFADVIQSQGSLPNKTSEPSHPISDQSYIPKDATTAWNCCALGILKNPILFNSLKVLFCTITHTEVSIIPIGGVSFMIKFKSMEEMRTVVDSLPGDVAQLFSVFRAWENGDAAFNRLCWILIRGIPPHAWCDDLFKVLTNKVGAMVDCSTETRNRERLDVAEILVLTENMASINCVLPVNVGGKVFKISIM
ncbi:hypothetical protein Tsubulata_040260 [Turnera subulata]|uniref:RRM domain-containing protein n=1 Tax=Turnera subulata TaxID=218843 RepID=A0A9Q0G415_9ROSI|nr:hypothetical protein Tsubulata_040260 [Turnera subulata]